MIYITGIHDTLIHIFNHHAVVILTYINSPKKAFTHSIFSVQLTQERQKRSLHHPLVVYHLIQTIHLCGRGLGPLVTSKNKHTHKKRKIEAP